MKVQIQLPVNLAVQDKELFSWFEHYEVDIAKIKKINDLFVTRSGIAIKKFSLIKETVHPWNNSQKYFLRYALGVYLFRKKIKLKKDYYLLIHNHWSGGYFHWICEAIHRLWLAKDCLNESILLIPESYKQPFFMESLEPFNIKKKFVIPEKVGLIVENLIIPDMKLGSFFDPEITNNVRKLYHDYLLRNKPNQKNLGERIYVSRSKAKQRKITNEQEVIELLKKYCFEIINFEDFSFWDEVSIMYHAKHIISIHGAGLTNMHFMQKGGNVLELYKKLLSPEDLYIKEYFQLSSILGLNYYYQFCPPEITSESVFKANLIVDIKELECNINLMLT